MTNQLIELYQFDDEVIPFTMDQNADISAYTFSFIVTTQADALVLSVTSAGGGISITDAGSSTTQGAIEVSLVDKLEITAATYKYELRRTNAGAEKVLASGTFRLWPSERDAA